MKIAAGFVLAGSVVVVAVTGDLRIAAVAAAVAVASGLLLDSRAVRSTLRVGIVLAMVFAGAITGAVVSWAEGAGKGIENGTLVLLRLLVLTTAAAVLVRRIDADALLVVAERVGLKRLGLVLGLALNSLPRIVEASSEVWIAASMRSRGVLDRTRRIAGLGEVLLAHTARIADEAAAAASLRGHSALTRPDLAPTRPVRTVVVTGPFNSGKTAAMTDLVGRFRANGVSFAGFAQLGVWREEKKVGFTLRDLETGETAPIATLADRDRGDFGTRFVFSDEGFALGKKALMRARPGGVVIVDELGPVELRGGGHMPAVRRALETDDLAALVVVVRRSLVPSLLDALEASDAVVIDMEERGENAAQLIFEAMGI